MRCEAVGEIVGLVVCVLVDLEGSIVEIEVPITRRVLDQTGTGEDGITETVEYITVALNGHKSSTDACDVGDEVFTLEFRNFDIVIAGESRDVPSDFEDGVDDTTFVTERGGNGTGVGYEVFLVDSIVLGGIYAEFDSE